jgi:alkanesulfonate monooxygenase SsuD/methylene tetrahydromethanopterin reductase-like flavin-dependent oxidoreductase (luciferase family)
VLGLAVVWRDDDYKASGVDHAARGRILDEQLAEMTRLWRGESVDGLGSVGPAPERDGGPEIMIGGRDEGRLPPRGGVRKWRDAGGRHARASGVRP